MIDKSTIPLLNDIKYSLETIQNSFGNENKHEAILVSYIIIQGYFLNHQETPTISPYERLSNNLVIPYGIQDLTISDGFADLL